MQKIVLKFFVLTILSTLACKGPSETTATGHWNNKKCAIVLSYDDGLHVHLDNVIPVLDKHDLQGTFYVHTDSDSFKDRTAEWKAASKKHELGNHTVFHPCAGKSKGRDWVRPDNDLDDYSLQDIIDEVTRASKSLQKVDGKTNRTYAYTCGDTSVKDTSFVAGISALFAAARGVERRHNSLTDMDLSNLYAFGISGHSASEMIAEVDKAINSESLLIFLFHGVGGEHDLNVTKRDHDTLIEYIASKKDSIYIAPLVEVVQELESKNG